MYFSLNIRMLQAALHEAMWQGEPRGPSSPEQAEAPSTTARSARLEVQVGERVHAHGNRARTMKIRTRAMLLGMLPALSLSLVLVIYHGHSRLGELESTLRERGAALTRHLALSAQYSVVSGNIAVIEPLLKNTLNEADVMAIAIYRPDGHLVTGVGDWPSGLALPLREELATSGQYLAYSMPVNIEALPIDDLFPAEAETSSLIVAWVQLVMSREGNQRVARVMMLTNLLIVVAGLLFAAVLVRVLALVGIKPLMEIIASVRRIGEGDLTVRLPLSAKSELKDLQAGINQMTESLDAYHHQLQARIAQATREMARQKSLAEQANAAKTRFLASVSHDLRQPLHAVGLYASTLRQRLRQPEHTELVGKLENSVAALEDMFNALLDLSRLEAGVWQPRVEACRVQTLFERIESDFSALARDKDLRLRIRPSPQVVVSDPVMLARILGNLVSNALRYCERGGVLVAARVRGNRVVVQVWDSGIGIGDENLPLIFEEYFQADNAGRDHRLGLGLGLNIVWRMCRLLEHPLAVRSRPGRGSVFELGLPRSNLRPEERRTTRDGHWSQFQGQLIALIEDDAVIRDALSGLLEEWGLTVVAADTVDTLLRSAKAAQCPRLVISDYHLADGITGLEVIARLRQHYSTDLPALLISGDTAPQSVAAMAASGIPVLYKPVRPAKLRALLRNLLKDRGGLDRPTPGRKGR